MDVVSSKGVQEIQTDGLIPAHIDLSNLGM